MRKEDIIVGTPVIFWKVMDGQTGQKSMPMKTKITSEPWALGHGAIVCKVEGYSGGVLIEHLEPLTIGSLIAAQAMGMTVTSTDMKDAFRAQTPAGVHVDFEISNLG